MSINYWPCICNFLIIFSYSLGRPNQLNVSKILLHFLAVSKIIDNVYLDFLNNNKNKENISRWTRIKKMGTNKKQWRRMITFTPIADDYDDMMKIVKVTKTIVFVLSCCNDFFLHFTY